MSLKQLTKTNIAASVFICLSYVYVSIDVAVATDVPVSKCSKTLTENSYSKKDFRREHGQKFFGSGYFKKILSRTQQAPK